MANESYATTDEHWALLNEVLTCKVAERGLDPHNIPAVLDLVREYWNLLNDIPTMQAYVASEKLKAAKAVQAKADEAAALRAQEIADLEAELGL